MSEEEKRILEIEKKIGDLEQVFLGAITDLGFKPLNTHKLYDVYAKDSLQYWEKYVKSYDYDLEDINFKIDSIREEIKDTKENKDERDEDVDKATNVVFERLRIHHISELKKNKAFYESMKRDITMINNYIELYKTYGDSIIGAIYECEYSIKSYEVPEFMDPPVKQWHTKIYYFDPFNNLIRSWSKSSAPKKIPQLPSF